LFPYLIFLDQFPFTIDKTKTTCCLSDYRFLIQHTVLGHERKIQNTPSFLHGVAKQCEHIFTIYSCGRPHLWDTDWL